MFVCLFSIYVISITIRLKQHDKLVKLIWCCKIIFKKQHERFQSIQWRINRCNVRLKYTSDRSPSITTPYTCDTSLNNLLKRTIVCCAVFIHKRSLQCLLAHHSLNVFKTLNPKPEMPSWPKENIEFKVECLFWPMKMLNLKHKFLLVQWKRWFYSRNAILICYVFIKGNRKSTEQLFSTSIN